MRISGEELRKKRQLEAERKEFARKIEEDRLGISRHKQKRVMRFMTYRIIKLVILGLTALALFFYTPAVLPLSAVNALMLITTKRIEKEKNKNINKRYRIKIRATDSIIAVMMIVLTVCVSGYSLVKTYINGGTLNDRMFVQRRLEDGGFDQGQVSSAMKRVGSETSAYERILNDALTLMTGTRNIFSSRGGPAGGGGPQMIIKDSEGNTTRSRPNILTMLRRMPLEMLFRQIFRMVCAVVAGVMIVIGVLNVIGSFKYGEIKRAALGKEFDVPAGPNDPCPCGSGKKRKNCCGSR